MDWYTPIARHLMIPLQARRDGSRWPWYVGEIASWETLSAEEIRARQWEKLQALLRHAYENVPYYHRVLDERKLKPSDLRSFEDLQLLPILSKQDVIAYGEQLVARNLSAHQLVDANTGGTTGIPMRFKRDLRCRDLHYAAMAAFERWCGREIGDRSGLVWGAQQDLVTDRGRKTRLMRRLLRAPRALNAYALSAAGMQQFAREMIAYRPRWLRGYPSALEVFGRFCREMAIAMSVPATVCTAEPLLESQRTAISESLDTEVFNEYAGRECGLMAMECRRHRGLHLNAFSVHLEVIVDGAAARPGTMGRVACTELDSYGMPLIRYDVGDMAALAVAPCDCGLALPLIASVEGRSVGMLVNAAGSLLSGNALVTLMRELGVPGQFQFVQREDLSVEVRVVASSQFTQGHQEAICGALRSLLGHGPGVEVVPVTEIPRAPSGKYTYVDSKAAVGRAMVGV